MADGRSMDEELRRFKDGGMRNTLTNVRFDLMSPIAARRLAALFAEGAKKYDDRNWEKGQPFSEILNHALNHLNLWLRGDRSEDHLAKVAWNIEAIMHLEVTKPEYNDMFPDEKK